MEDYAYAELAPGEVERLLARFPSDRWIPQTIAIDVRRKIEAVRQYRTQISRVFGSERDMVRRISQFTVGTACALEEKLRAKSQTWRDPSEPQL